MIWTWLKDGEPRGFFKNEHSLLVSYDMIPLLGLDEMRRELNHEGEIATGRLIVTEDSDLFVPFDDGEPALEAIDWGCHYSTYTKSLRCLCSFLSFAPDEPHRNKFGIGAKDNAILREFDWRACSCDGRRRRPLSRLELLVEVVLLDLGFQVRPVQFVVSG